MRFSRFGAFSLGVVLTAVSVGTVSFVTAASDRQYTACANKKTGAMRLLSKGKCKKTETTIRWNQQGPQGLPGAQGIQGVTGQKGDPGQSGAAGQNLFAVDSRGETLGPIRGLSQGSALIEFGDHLWDLALMSPLVISGQGSIYYRDSLCTQRRISMSTQAVPHPQIATVDLGADQEFQFSDVTVMPIGSALSVASELNYQWTGGTCTSIPSNSKAELASSQQAFATEIASPAPFYVAPITVVSR